MCRWLLRVAFLSFAGYPAAVVTSDYFAVSATAWLRRIGLEERALRVRLEGPVLRVALTWSCRVVRIGDRPLLAVPLSVERFFPFP